MMPAREENVLASLAPEAGHCLLFFQPGLLHEGEEVRGGIKHILRTEVMFRRDPATKPERTPEQLEARSLAEQAETAAENCDFELSRKLYGRAFSLDPRLERMY
eukprot:NODE_2897_length_857_cov_319.674564.p2 GENE.NODE_2897_length_857_cov_319.674564~~NODE_2897_length_857_cov_319.674564.p2  ORF type:complete len:120 (+),score=41.00 NODE_2897_length_857_cov_319.674564:50-361(+)